MHIGYSDLSYDAPCTYNALAMIRIFFSSISTRRSLSRVSADSATSLASQPVVGVRAASTQLLRECFIIDEQRVEGALRKAS